MPEPTTEQPRYWSSKAIADWAVRQSRENHGTWHGLATAQIPTYAQIAH